ncbi:hypothetical protein OIU34_19320 [Pararhizobium sp. BT-229]|uniref:hypothetical protein n=1 Tax=Pararhizobium sp. BT-229 TaxID=2986923 RepID=UPI0021F6B4DF|nr:hypothetical protein [Pararhizobium sp. BT-229]MCV9964034.1 hypothetical protein [Pararhizobium sp. BT-229]
MSRQSEGGKARARNLSDKRRSEIAQAAATARWAGGKATPPDNAPPTDDAVGRRNLHCGAGLVRNTLKRLSVDQRKAFVMTLWPDLPERLATLIARFPDEMRVNGSQLQLPPSWSSIAEDE